VERAGRPSDDVILRALSVVPFVLVAAFGVIALVGWISVIVFGLSAPGSDGGEPIWRWVQGRSLGHVAGQLALAAGVALVPLGVTLLAGWATIHGFRSDPHRYFWPAAQLFWGVVGLGLVIVDRVWPETLRYVGVSTLDWWFAFVMVAVALILAGVRARRRSRE